MQALKAVGSGDMTLLHCAAQNGYFACACVLLEVLLAWLGRVRFSIRVSRVRVSGVRVIM